MLRPWGFAPRNAESIPDAQLSEEYKNDAIYAAAVYNVDKADRPHIESAISMLEAITDYKDSAELLEKENGIFRRMTRLQAVNAGWTMTKE